jgi:hypothetical protein
MLHTNATTYRSGLPFTPSGTPSSHLLTEEHVMVRQQPRGELAIDDALTASFPASDPPAWNPGMARLTPAAASRHRADDVRSGAARDENAIGAPGVIDVSRPHGSERTLRRALVSLGGAAGIALLVPFAMVLVGLAIEFAGRGLLAVIAWLFAATR